MEIFWGPERKERLQQLIFGPRDAITPESKTQINDLQNMITLSPDAHCTWAHGRFTLEPMGAEANNPHELRVRVKWTPRHSENPKEVGIAADSTSIELIPITNGEGLFDLESFSPISGKVSRIVDGHIVTFRSNDLLNASLPNRDLFMLQCFVVRVLRMAGRYGEDMLETFGTDDEASSLAASNAGSSEEQTVPEIAQPAPYHDGTTDLGKSRLAPSPDLGGNVATLLEQPPQKERQKPSSTTPKLWSYLRNFLRTAKMATTGQPGCLPKKRIDTNRRLRGPRPA